MAPLLLEHLPFDLHMIRKAFATLLLMLVAMPFTAPFSTCDAGTLFGDQTTALPHHSPTAPSIDEGGHGLPLVGSFGRLRLRFAWDIHRGDRRAAVGLRSIDVARSASAAPPSFVRGSLVALRI